MPVSVTMPALGESVTEGTVTRWLKAVGDTVTADEPLLEVSTDKVDTEIPAPASGVLTEIKVAEDETVAVGAELAVIDGGDGASTGAAAASSAAQSPAAAPTAAGDASGGEAPSATQPDTAQSGGAQSGGAQSGGAQSDGARPGAAEPVAVPSADAPVEAEQPAPAAAQAQADASADGGDNTVISMPALGESVTEGTVTRWLKQVGDTVAADEALLEVSTDKVNTEIPSPAAGTLLEIKVGEDETVAVGAPLAVIGTSGGSSTATPAAATPAAAAAAAASAATPAAAPTPASASAPAASAPGSSGLGASAAGSSASSAPAAAAGSAFTTPPASASTGPAPASPGVAVPAPVGSSASPAATGGETDASEGAYVTPLVRKLAAEHGVNLSVLSGTGVGGRIRKQDVLAAAEAAKAPAPAATPAPAAPAAKPAAAPSPLRGRTEKMTRMRQVIAKRMVESLQVSAQLTTVVEVDVTKIARLRDAAKADFAARNGVKLSFLPFFALASVEALRVHPNVNCSLDMEAGTVTYHDAEHLGMAVDTDRGLMVPVIRDAGDLNLAGLARRIADLAERTRTNKVTPDELSGGTFTLTNTGSRGALFDTPIINQPQVAILGTGSVVKRAVVVDDPDLGEIIVPRSMIYLALSYDHRIIDGADAARFLTTIKERLEAGAFEGELGLA